MSRRRRPRFLSKATRPAAPAPEVTYSARQVQALLGAYTRTTGLINPLPRSPEYPFGPGVPVIPAPFDPPRPDGSGRVEPRIYEYPVSINLPGMTDRLVPWKVLRDASEIPVVRDCIRIRKNQVATLEWDITVTKRALQQYKKKDPDTSSVTLQKQLREKLNPEIGRLVEFWQIPDFQQGEGFVDWATKVLEEHLVLDAVAVYPFRDRSGEHIGLRVLDGSTVKPLLDHQGGRPMPPHPAFQQMLWGFPRGEFIADVDPDTGEVINGYPADRLIYRRREVRTHSPYGYSAVEQALQDVDLYLRRLEWQKAEYTEGVQPAGWIKNTGLDSWTPQQIVDYSRAFNDLYAGQTLTRMRYHLLPPGMEPAEAADNAEKYKADYDLYLVKLVAMHFDVTISELGFTELKGMGSSGYHEGQENVQERKATNPTLKWLQGILTDISRTHLGMPPELEFTFLGLDAEDEAAEDAVVESQLRSGRITWNEAREELGRAPYSFDEADMAAVVTPRGMIFMDGASAIAPPGSEIGPALPVPEPPSASQGGNDQDGQQEGQPEEATQSPAVTKAAYGSHTDRMERVYEQLREDYPPEACEWVRRARWVGPVQVPLDKVDFENRQHWQASHEQNKVRKFEAKIRRGWMKPVVLVQTPTKKKLIVIDGHHRSLAYRALHRPVMAWVARVTRSTGPWDEMHASQRVSADLDSTGSLPKAVDITAPEVLAEVAAFKKWVKNGHGNHRLFEFHHLTPERASWYGVDPMSRVAFKVSDARPKAHWPGWGVDQRIATHWATALRNALTGAPTRNTAERWLEARKAATTDPGAEERRREVLAWLVSVGFTLTPRIRAVLAGLYTDAYMVGDQSAQVLLGQAGHPGWDGSGWKPGDTTAARNLITAAGADTGLGSLLDQSAGVAAGINDTRMQAIAGALADAAPGTTSDALDAELHQILDDPASAESVTLTEATRASTLAALNRYTITPGVTQYQWLTSAGSNVCRLCQENADVGPIDIGAVFPNGGPPPQHVNCSCALIGVPDLSGLLS